MSLQWNWPSVEVMSFSCTSRERYGSGSAEPSIGSMPGSGRLAKRQNSSSGRVSTVPAAAATTLVSEWLKLLCVAGVSVFVQKELVEQAVNLQQPFAV